MSHLWTPTAAKSYSKSKAKGEQLLSSRLPVQGAAYTSAGSFLSASGTEGKLARQFIQVKSSAVAGALLYLKKNKKKKKKKQASRQLLPYSRHERVTMLPSPW